MSKLSSLRMYVTCNVVDLIVVQQRAVLFVDDFVVKVVSGYRGALVRMPWRIILRYSTGICDFAVLPVMPLCGSPLARTPSRCN